jgi:hypothetical protein
MSAAKAHKARREEASLAVKRIKATISRSLLRRIENRIETEKGGYHNSKAHPIIQPGKSGEKAKRNETKV